MSKKKIGKNPKPSVKRVTLPPKKINSDIPKPKTTATPKKLKPQDLEQAQFKLKPEELTINQPSNMPRQSCSPNAKNREPKPVEKKNKNKVHGFSRASRVSPVKGLSERRSTKCVVDDINNIYRQHQLDQLLIDEND